MTQKKNITFCWLLRILLTLTLSLGSLFTMSGCRDTVSVCQHYVDKYIYCFRRSHQRAAIRTRRLPKQQRLRMQPFLHALSLKIKDPTWRKNAVQRCLQTPPSKQRYRCIRDSKCQQLSLCDPKHPK